MVYYDGDSLTLHYSPIQKQRQHSDCGLYAIAVATALCHGLHPSSLQWDQPAMRGHLIDCLKSGKIVPFPVTSVKPMSVGQNFGIMKK